MIKHLVVASLLITLITAQKPPTEPWLTLNGQRPAVIARGGFSGLFPDSCDNAYLFVSQVSLADAISYCDLQLTKDGVGFCKTELRLENTTNIATVFPDGQKTYFINGKEVRGWFALDYLSADILRVVTSSQSILTRPSSFDNQILVKLESLTMLDPPPIVWLNVQYDMFYNEHQISPALYLEKLKFAGVSYISSPEIGFLKSIGAKVDRAQIKLILSILEPEAVEPTTKQTYGDILKNLAAIKPFASGILVPKTFIWPVNKDMYLLPPTTLVNDAHKAGLEVYASGFANDFPGSFNYSYDPSAEYLQFIDNGIFSVDGVLTDFPSTASEAIACLAHNKNASKPQNVNALVISHNGASGDYPGCTDLAYEKAVTDGADIIDCSVQMSKDGVAFCLDTADLLGDTNAITLFMSRSSSVPEIQPKNGIFSFDLTWSEIQTLKPQLVGLPQEQGGLPRNPANKDKGKFLSLAEFLDLAKAKAVSGVLINIENAAYLASKKGLDIVSAVTTALSNATLDKQTTQKVMIQSDDTSVLAKLKDFPTYQRVYTIKEVISEVPKQSADEIKKFADAVDIRRPSAFRSAGFFLANFTQVIQQLHAANISVHVSVLYNEYSTIPFDFFADPLLELATLIEGLQADAVVTDFPATANRYLRSPCSDPNNDKLEYPITPAMPGVLLDIVAPDAKPPVAAPAPTLNSPDIVDPPLPPLAKVESPATAPPPEQKNVASHQSSTGFYLSIVIAMAVTLLLKGH